RRLAGILRAPERRLLHVLPRATRAVHGEHARRMLQVRRRRLRVQARFVPRREVAARWPDRFPPWRLERRGSRQSRSLRGVYRRSGTGFFLTLEPPSRPAERVRWEPKPREMTNRAWLRPASSAKPLDANRTTSRKAAPHRCR